MKSYVDEIIVTDPSGEKSILYPATKQEAVEGLLERLANVEKPDIAETTSPTMPNSYDGRLLVEEIGGGESQQGENPSPTNQQEIKKTVVSEIKTHGRQFFDINTYPLKEGYYVSGSNGKDASSESYAHTPYIPCSQWRGMTLTLNKRPGGAYPGIAFYLEKSVPSFISGVINNSSTAGKPITFTVPTNAVYMRFTVPANATEIMLNEGTEALPYEPYTESVITLSQPIELYGIGDVQDIIEDKKVKRKLAGIVFDGSSDEHWYSENHYFRIARGNTNNKISALCTHLRQTKDYSVVNSTNGTGTFYVGSDNLTINMKGICSTVTELRAWLASNPITIVHGIVNEVTEDLPIVDQIALNSLSTFDGITYLEFDSEIEPTFKGEYGTSKVGGYTLEGMLAGRNGELYGKDFANRITALETTVVNNI